MFIILFILLWVVSFLLGFGAWRSIIKEQKELEAMDIVMVISFLIPFLGFGFFLAAKVDELEPIKNPFFKKR